MFRERFAIEYGGRPLLATAFRQKLWQWFAMAMAVDVGEDLEKRWAVLAALSDPGTARQTNEDACGTYLASPTCALVVVADGVSGYEGGEIASQTAVDVTIRAFRESPPSWGAMKRLHRAVQQANIEIHDRALVVTELRRMSTTLTAALVQDGILYAAHVGDSRLYLIRDGSVIQKTKDHTVAADRARIGLGMRAKDHPDRWTLTRSLGTELIAAIDRITFPLVKSDMLLICTDGLYNVLDDPEIHDQIAGKDAQSACSALIAAANARGTPDNLTAAVLGVTINSPSSPPSGWRNVLDRLLGR
jgi:PPM family protein phosphatase